LLEKRFEKSLLEFVKTHTGWYEPVSRCVSGQQPGELLIGVKGPRVIGFTGPIQVRADGAGQFTGIAVHPDFRRRKIGTVLFHRLLDMLKGKGATYVRLTTRTVNPARQLYRKAGFRELAVWVRMKRSVT